MEHSRILAFSAAALGIVAAIMLSDGWWFLLGLIGFVLLFFTGEINED
ncbi:hypothetical protein [Prauserella cavernicola]|uniref:Uncharacterized protein n=1 Tax=Prauserella cavernicola TaxID=2800127 RepID=A0A934V6A5_9PSEU|nr:hypothetical protein [Prauserella cavernicola]MBK1786519.1 hypothetical protein [Prauserella cavernicola]